MSSQFGERRPTSGWDIFVILRHSSKFQMVSHLDFVTAATSLNGTNETLHDVWPSPGMVHDIYIFGDSCPVTEFCQVQNSFCVQVLRSPVLAALLHGTRVAGVGHQPNFAAFSRRCQLYSAGRLSRWTLAHILVPSSIAILLQYYLPVLLTTLVKSLHYYIILCRNRTWN